jgi:cytoskeletal protein CcmA (bactofilin family)
VASTAAGRNIIGEDLVIVGEVRNGGDIEVHGAVIGRLRAVRVVVRPGARVIGTLEADSADVQGLVDGHVRVRNLVSIGAGGEVRGDVRYGQLALAPGGDLAAEVRNISPELTGDFEVVVRRGRSVRVTGADIAGIDPDGEEQALVYHVSAEQGGHIALAHAPAAPVGQFAEGDLQNGNVLFVHDGSEGTSAGFAIVVADAAGATSGAPRRVTVAVL